MSDDNIVNSENKLVCIHYPGIVNNVDKAVETLNGLSAIANASFTTQSLKLRFNNDNLFTKPICSQAENTAGLLIKVRLKRNKQTKQIVSLTTSVLGKVEKIFEFKGIFDFHLLPLAPKPGRCGTQPGDLTCIIDQLLPEGLPDPEWMNLPAPLYLQPYTFSRTDTIHHIYSFQDSSTSEALSLEEALQSSFRESRQKPIARIHFTLSDDFPTKPSDELMELYKTITFKDPEMEIVKKLFEEQPIWSLRGLLYKSGLKYGTMSAILPVISICYLNGPWRRMYIRLGYDPRKNPQSRIYQTIDFRMKYTPDMQFTVQRRRSNLWKNKSNVTQINLQHPDNIERDENSYVFALGHLPPKKQMLYQVCNIKVPAVEEMLSHLPALLPGALCHEKTGWLPAGFEESVRDILMQVVNVEIRKTFSSKKEDPEPIQEKTLMGESDDSDEDAMRDEFDD